MFGAPLRFKGANRGFSRAAEFLHAVLAGTMQTDRDPSRLAARETDDRGCLAEVFRPTGFIHQMEGVNSCLTFRPF